MMPLLEFNTASLARPDGGSVLPPAFFAAILRLLEANELAAARFAVSFTRSSAVIASYSTTRR
jgi:hypothetical protein